MFTGIIEEVGKIRAVNAAGQGGKITVAAKNVTDGVKLGESIAINGVCLTVIEFDSRSLAFDISAETLALTTLGRLRPGMPVNLERSLAVGGRLGGHIVQGHVDGRGEFLSRRVVGDGVVIRFGYPSELGRYICLKGSIAVEGISLTVSGLDAGWFEVAIIPHTLKMTNLGSLESGDPINLEVDIVAKYIERLVQGESSAQKPKLTMENLRDLGY
jgi:riboflavin synthase